MKQKIPGILFLFAMPLSVLLHIKVEALSGSEILGKEKARRKAKAKREQARKEWEERPQILYTPMGNKR